MKRVISFILIVGLLFVVGCENKDASVSIKKENEAVSVSGKPKPDTQANPSEETVPTIEGPEPADTDIVKILDYIPDAVIDLRYATANNFTGVIIYEDDAAFLRYGTVKKLAAVQEKLNEKGLRILIWDAYRPKEAQFRLWEVCPDPAFVANPNKGFSSHSRGNTVDISVVDEKGNPLEMPSEFDEFNKKADRNYNDVSDIAAENSLMLETIMTECGFVGYSGEWWHYTDTQDYPVE